MWASFVVIFNPMTRKPEIYQLKAVPFGGTRAVFSFLRVARSIWYLGASQLDFVWSNFYDDFIIFSCSDLAKNTHLAVETFFDLLGWRFARDGEKANDFSLRFSGLGIQIDLSKFNEGIVEFSNTLKRTEELIQTIDGFLCSRKMSLKDSQKLRGRMQFADSQLFGRVGRLCMRAVTAHGFSGDGPKLKRECIDALTRFRNFLSASKPRQILHSSKKTWFVFTDACYEPTSSDWKCGLGGIIYSPCGSIFQFFSVSLNESQIHALGGSDKRTIIFEAELLALVVALNLWRPLFGGCPTAFYVDNNSARDVAISGCGRSAVANSLLDTLLEAEMHSGIFAWYSRVPSPSNPADDPSRGSSSWLKAFGSTLVNVSDWLDVLFQKLPCDVG